MVYAWYYWYICRSYRCLTIGIRAISLAKEGKICFLFLQNFFLGKKKRAAHFRFIYKVLRAEFGEKNWVFEFLSENYPISKKKSAETEFRN
jgi:hypothetical protein